MIQIQNFHFELKVKTNMSEFYAKPDKEITLTMPNPDGVYLGSASQSAIYNIVTHHEKIIITDHKGKNIGVIEAGETRCLKVVKPKWWQFISRILKRYKWVIQ